MGKVKMDHYYKDVQGWFTFPILYSWIVDKLKDNSHIVEVGAWLGQSVTYMGVEIINSGKTIKFDCVDTWEGSSECVNEDGLLSTAGAFAWDIGAGAFYGIVGLVSGSADEGSDNEEGERINV